MWKFRLERGRVVFISGFEKIANAPGGFLAEIEIMGYRGSAARHRFFHSLDIGLHAERHGYIDLIIGADQSIGFGDSYKINPLRQAHLPTAF